MEDKPQPDKLDQIISVLGKGDVQAKDSDLYRMFEYFVSEQGIMGKTIVTPQQRNCILVLETWHERYPKRGLDKAAKRLMLLFISQAGKDNSRQGMVELFKGFLQQRQNDISPPMGNPRDVTDIKGTRF